MEGGAARGQTAHGGGAEDAVQADRHSSATPALAPGEVDVTWDETTKSPRQ